MVASAIKRLCARPSAVRLRFFFGAQPSLKNTTEPAGHDNVNHEFRGGHLPYIRKKRRGEPYDTLRGKHNCQQPHQEYDRSKNLKVDRRTSPYEYKQLLTANPLPLMLKPQTYTCDHQHPSNFSPRQYCFSNLVFYEHGVSSGSSGCLGALGRGRRPRATELCHS